MTGKESFRERQIQELEVIKSIFGSDVDDLRAARKNATSATNWRPTDIRIFLTPLRDSSNGQTEAYVSTKLRIICPSKYPKVTPKISLEETKGISDSLIDELHDQLQKQSNELKGEVMIYELAQTVQTFLLQHNKPPRGSFYDEMLRERQKQMNLQKAKETLERQTLIDEVERRKEIFKTEGKRRGEPRRSISESNRHPSSSESSDSTSPYFRGHSYPNKCMEHRNSETLYFPKIGRQIKRGCCLGHSQKGCIAYTGIDIDSGQLLYITEWNVKYSQIEQKCATGGKCHWGPSELKCSGSHLVDDFIASIEKQVHNLSQLHHKHLIQYECVLCIKRKEGLVIYLVQDFVLGTSVFSISTTLGWCMDGARMVARGVLNALVFLHNKGVSHSHLLDTTVFVDNTGIIRVTDFSIVPNLLEVIGGSVQKTTQGDLPALGTLVERMMATTTFEMRDFIDKCNSNRTLSASELLEHPFLRSSLFTHEEKDIAPDRGLTTGINQSQRKRSITVSQCDNGPIDTVLATDQQSKNAQNSSHTFSSLSVSQSRLRTEFEVITYLGKGAFGDVLKVRNILDNREYAIKRILLPARSRQLYKKMTREVELLSRLNHENVVRYFNSWIESAQAEDVDEIEKMASNDWSLSHDSLKSTVSPQCTIAVNVTEENSASLWNAFLPNIEDSDSDGIEFVDSNGEIAVYDDDNGDVEDKEKLPSKIPLPNTPLQIMYIQMEFCEKCTLRTTIDDNLYLNTDRLWRLFREIAEGLSHIHQQGIIHRDLKPVNIFLDSRDQIKIGDFGLATTSFLALQTQDPANSVMYNTITEDGTGTGIVGTTLYVAPELTGNASKSTYNQKVDMYTLGIILFEMIQPPFATSMERVQTIMSLRSPSIILPPSLLNDNKYEKTVKIIRWLLSHDPAQRPTAEELLSSDLVPPAQLEANELQEMLRHALANPQSKAYKHLVARCLQQESDEILEHTYHLSRAIKSWNTSTTTLDGFFSLNPVFEFVKTKIVNLFRKHGALEVDTPLLSPYTQRVNHWLNPVKLMTHSGCVVVLPSDLRTQFARHIAMSGVNSIRRYCIDRVYREEKVFNFHPRQYYECAFDIITPNSGSHLTDAELLSLAFEITEQVPRLREKNICIRVNHTSLLRSILLHCNVPKTLYSDLFGNILDYIEGRISKFQFHSSVTVIMEKSRSSASALIDLLLADFPLSVSRSNVDETSLKSLVRGKGEAASLAKGAIRDLEIIVSLAQSLGVKCPIRLFTGLPISFDRASSGGIVWQMIADLKSNRTTRPTVLAVGERYDSMLNEFQKKAQSFNVNTPARGVCGAGLSFSLDKLIAAAGPEFSEDECRIIDVGVYVSGSRPPLKDVTNIMRLLWSSGVRCAIIESASGMDETQELTKLGALHVILVAENGALRVRTWDRERFQERHVTRTELVEYIQKLVRTDGKNQNAIEYQTQQSGSGNSGGCSGIVCGSGLSSGSGRGDGAIGTGFNTSSSNTSLKNYFNASSLSQLPNVQVVFLTHDKLTANLRRRYENQVTQQMTSTLSQFVKKVTFNVLIVDLPPCTLNSIVGAINPRSVCKKQKESEMSHVIERFPKHKRYITEIFEEVEDLLNDPKTPIVALYSISDSCYRVII